MLNPKTRRTAESVSIDDTIPTFSHSEQLHYEATLGIVKAGMELDNVNNTSDIDKPLSTATNAELAILRDAIANQPSLPNVDFATTANDTLSGLTARDGYTPTANQFALVKNQTNTANNGIYRVASSTWIRQAYNTTTQTWADVATQTTYSELNIQNGILNVLNGTANKNLRFKINIVNPQATFGNSAVQITATTLNPPRDFFNSFVSVNIGNNTNHNGISTLPYATVAQALTGAQFPHTITVACSGSSYSESVSLTSSQPNLTLQANNRDSTAGKVQFTGTLTLASGNTRYREVGITRSTGASTPVTISAGNLGIHTFENCIWTTTNATILSLDASLTNNIDLINIDATGSVNGSIPLPNFTSPFTINIFRQSKPLVFSGTGQNCTINIYGSPKGVAFLPAGFLGAVNYRDNYNVNSVITSQTELDAILSATNLLGFYAVSFANPTGMPAGSIFLKYPNVPIGFLVDTFDNTVSTIYDKNTKQTYIKDGSGSFNSWVVPSAGSSGGASNLNDLSDVSVTTPVAGEVLQYNINTNLWENGALSIGDVDSLQVALDGKVDTITGKGLSTNDFTTAEKTKLSGIADGATANETDANLKNRENHTGTQTASTIADFHTQVSANSDVTANTNARHTHSNKPALDSITGTNTGDETQTSIKTKLGSASPTQDGYLTQGDYNTFNNKQNAITKADIYNQEKDILVAGTNISINANDTNKTLTINSTGGGGFIPYISSVSVSAGATINTSANGYDIRMQIGNSATATLNSTTNGIQPNGILSNLPSNITQAISGNPTPSSVAINLTPTDSTLVAKTNISYLGNEAWTGTQISVQLESLISALGVTTIDSKLLIMGMRQISNPGQTDDGKLELIVCCNNSTAITTATASSFNLTWASYGIYALVIDKNFGAVTSQTLINTSGQLQIINSSSNNLGKVAFYTPTGWIINARQVTLNTNVVVGGQTITPLSTGVLDMVIFKLNTSLQHVWHIKARSAGANCSTGTFYSNDTSLLGLWVHANSSGATNNSMTVYTSASGTSEVINNPNTKDCGFGGAFAINTTTGAFANNYALLNYTEDTAVYPFCSDSRCKIAFTNDNTKMYLAGYDGQATSTVATVLTPYNLSTNALTTSQRKTSTFANATQGYAQQWYLAGMTLSTGVMMTLGKFTTANSTGNFFVHNFIVSSTGKIAMYGSRNSANTGVGFTGTSTLTVTPQASTPTSMDFAFLIVVTDGGTTFTPTKAIGSSTADTASSRNNISSQDTMFVVDGSNNVYIAGQANTTTMTLDGQNIITGNTSGTVRRYVLKYNPDFTTLTSSAQSTPNTSLTKGFIFYSTADNFIALQGSTDLQKIATF